YLFIIILPPMLSPHFPYTTLFRSGIIVLLFAMIFKFLPDVKIQWRDVWIGAVMTAILFGVGKWALGFYLGSGAAGSDGADPNVSDRKSTRLNSSHVAISYAVFCLK